MDANVSLALATKIKMLLTPDASAESSKFIAFVPPATSLVFGYENLAFFDQESPLAATLPAATLETNKQQFAQIVNTIPADNTVYSPMIGDDLGRVFSRIIGDAVIARSRLTDEEKGALSKANKYLDDNFEKYMTCLKEVNRCEYNFNEAHLSVQYADGNQKDRLQKEWDDFRKDALQQEIDLAKNNLLVTGKSAEVENNLRIKKNLEVNSMQDLKDDLATTLTLLDGTDPKTRLEYLSTLYSPMGVYSETSGGWSNITLYNSEIRSLCETAPPELKGLYAGDDSGEDIQSISFEYSIVSLVRPWFSEDFLRSQGFKFHDDVVRQISDGQVPANGVIPAYISKLISIRKVRYKISREKPPTKPVTMQILSLQPLSKFKIKDIPMEKRHFALRKETPAVAVQPARRLHMAVAMRPMLFRAAGVAAIQPKEGDTEEIRIKKKDKVLGDWRRKHIAVAIDRKRFDIKEGTLAAKDDTSEIIEESFDGIRIVAFECKRVGLSPNPDPTLDWL